MNIKLKKNQQKVPSPPPKLSASDRRTCGNFQHWRWRLYIESAPRPLCFDRTVPIWCHLVMTAVDLQRTVHVAIWYYNIIFFYSQSGICDSPAAGGKYCWPRTEHYQRESIWRCDWNCPCCPSQVLLPWYEDICYFLRRGRWRRRRSVHWTNASLPRAGVHKDMPWRWLWRATTAIWRGW